MEDLVCVLAVARLQTEGEQMFHGHEKHKKVNKVSKANKIQTGSLSPTK